MFSVSEQWWGEAVELFFGNLFTGLCVDEKALKF